MINTIKSPDLAQVKAEFAAWRSSRVGKKHLPENLWAAAVALLAKYPFSVVCSELRLKPNYLRRRVEGESGKLNQTKKKPGFLLVTGEQLATINNTPTPNNAAAYSLTQSSQCRLVIERIDGSRLSFSLPVDWTKIETLCTNFLRA